jgi:hypothetical protein
MKIEKLSIEKILNNCYNPKKIKYFIFNTQEFLLFAEKNLNINTIDVIDKIFIFMMDDLGKYANVFTYHKEFYNTYEILYNKISNKNYYTSFYNEKKIDKIDPKYLKILNDHEFKKEIKKNMKLLKNTKGINYSNKNETYLNIVKKITKQYENIKFKKLNKKN